MNGWAMITDSIGAHGNYYFKRAIILMAGLGAIPSEDAVYSLNVADTDDKSPFMMRLDFRLQMN